MKSLLPTAAGTFDFKLPLDVLNGAPAGTLERRILSKYLRTRKIVCEDDPDAHTSWIVVDHQSFCIGTHEAEEFASAFCIQAAIALARMASQLQEEQHVAMLKTKH